MPGDRLEKNAVSGPQKLPMDNDYDNALSIDKHNGNNKWAKAIKLEIYHQHDHDTCKDMGEGSSPKGNIHVRSHFIFDVKHDGLHKDRLLADGNLTDVHISSVYLDFVSLRGIMLVLFLAELNNLCS